MSSKATQKQRKQKITSISVIKLKEAFADFGRVPKAVKKKKNKDIEKDDRNSPHTSSQLQICGNLAKGKLEYDENKTVEVIYYAWNGWNFIGDKGESNRDVYSGKKPDLGTTYTLFEGYDFWNKDYPGNFNKVYGVKKLKRTKIFEKLEFIKNTTETSEEKEALEDILDSLSFLLKRKSGTIGQSLPYRWQAHHILPMSAFTGYFEEDDIEIICRSDYDINMGSNIIFLPELSKAMKYHQLPGHWSDHPEYTSKVKTEFGRMQEKLDEIKEKDKDHEKSAPKFELKLKILESKMFNLLVKAGPKALHLISESELN